MTEGLAREGFDIDLLHGKAREDAFAHVLTRAKVECKSDGKCRSTGNVFIEFRQRGRDSGIKTTTADWWAIEYADDCWVVLPTQRLIALARQAYRVKGSVRGGDGDEYEGVLIPIEWFVRPFRAA